MKFEDYYKKYYGFLRRAFWDYVTVFGSENYFTWATVVLKVPAANIGYYMSKNAAVQAGTPDGKLDADLSDFYLRDIPVVFNNQSDSYFKAIIAGEPFQLNRVGDVVLQLNVWLPDSGWTPIYVPYDTTNMEITGSAIKLTGMNDLVDDILPLQDQLIITARELQNNHNTTLNAMQTDPAAGQAESLAVLCDNIVNLRSSDAFLVKVSPDCSAPIMGQSVFEGLIILNAAIAFSAMPVLKADPSIKQDFVARLTAQDVLSSIMLHGTKQTILSKNTGMPVATATPTPENKKSNAIWWVLGIGVGAYLLSNSSKDGAGKSRK